MLRLRSDLPLRGDTASRFVFWIVAILVFVAALAVTASSYVDALLEGWNRSVTGTLTIQIPTGGAEDNSSASVSNLLDTLRKHSDVVSAVVLPNEKISELLEPWLGESSIIADLPLPLLVDVHLSDSTAEAAKNIVELTQRTAPTAIVEDHRVWLNRIIGLAEGLSVIALSVMGLVTGALSLIVIFATRASLTEYAQAIDVLHIVGAKDGYVAGQFARRAFAQGFFGGIAGLALYGPTLGAITWLAGRVEKGLLPDITMPIRHWLILLALPAAAGGLAMFTANITVRRILARRV
jgi:cell division transport system permease protein